MFDNKIAEIESKAFEATLAKLEYIALNNNKLKFLTPETFKNSGGTRISIYLESNVCVDRKMSYYSNGLDFERDLKANCTNQVHR